MVKPAPDTWFTRTIKRLVLVILVFMLALFAVRCNNETFGEKPAPTQSQQP